MAKITMADIRAACPLWFSKDTMRFFRSQVGRTVYQGDGGIFFVSSEQFVGSNGVAAPRRYTVRQFKPGNPDMDRDASIDTVARFNALDEKEARSTARTCAKYGAPVATD